MSQKTGCTHCGHEQMMISVKKNLVVKQTQTHIYYNSANDLPALQRQNLYLVLSVSVAVVIA